MKRKILLFICLLTTFTVSGQVRDSLTLDEAIRIGTVSLSERIPNETTIAIVNFTAPQGASDYVIGELTSRLVNTGRFIVVDRHSLALVEKEMNFQHSGIVSDESAQAIGRALGAQTIISGSLTPFGNSHRMQIRALEVETLRIQGNITYTIRRDAVIANLIPPEPKTTGEKAEIGAKNILFGLGSYLDRDIVGGLTITAGYVLAIGLFAVEALAMDRENPAVGVPATIGFSVVCLTIVYG